MCYRACSSGLGIKLAADRVVLSLSLTGQDFPTNLGTF